MRNPVLLVTLLLVGCGGATEQSAPPGDAAPDAAPDVSPAPVVDAQPEAQPAPSCSDPRFSVAGDLVTDAKTGLTWMWDVESAVAGFAPDYCASINGGRSPTVAELATLLVHPGVCVPAIDQRAFINAATIGDAYATDGCVDFRTGATKAACAGASVSMLCIAP